MPCGRKSHFILSSHCSSAIPRHAIACWSALAPDVLTFSIAPWGLLARSPATVLVLFFLCDPHVQTSIVAPFQSLYYPELQRRSRDACPTDSKTRLRWNLAGFGQNVEHASRIACSESSDAPSNPPDAVARLPRWLEALSLITMFSRAWKGYKQARWRGSGKRTGIAAGSTAREEVLASDATRMVSTCPFPSARIFLGREG
ncbi:hypothetical protein DENSPDRAFT_372799 [Dentipellis sp. KUC8613]|nr:hypothetical protein DENSPDRAFT_372799 [Dentipellis sp. KUC8613]